MFIDRNEQGDIVALYANQQYDGQEWLENAELPIVSVAPVDPVAKLKEFLAANPDVAALLGA